MQEYHLKISEDSDKALALLDYLKTLDFVQLTKANDWWDGLSKKNKESIQKGENDLERGHTFSNEEVSKSIRQRIEATKK